MSTHWSNIKAVPDWFGAQSQGAGIAIADISNNGRPDMVVFHVDDPDGENHGFYRIGWNLNANGDVTGGWSPIKAVPGWFGADDQGAGIAIADINNNGRPDLFVFHIDNPGGENHGFYRIGWNLNANGDVTGGWSPIKAVPGWFGAEDQGADIAIATIGGVRHLIVFHLENPGGDNHGYYRVGWNLNMSGDVTGGWSEVRPVPGGVGTENQGAGTAVTDLNGDGQPDLVVFHIDNPGGDNHGYYRFCKSILLENAEVLAVHAALLHTGKVLYFSGDQHDPDNNAAGRVDATRLWDVSSSAIRRVSSPRHDLFCSGHGFLPDGSLLVAGGTQEWKSVKGDPHGHGALDHFRGLRNTTIFNANTNTWNATVPMNVERIERMGGGRWYPTLLTLPDGSVFAMSGHPSREDRRHKNFTLEVFDAGPPHRWKDHGDKPDVPESYPRLHVLPSGEVLCVTPMSGKTQRLRLGSTWTPVADDAYDEGFWWTSVLLPLEPNDYRTRVLIAGGEKARVLDLGNGGVGESRWVDTVDREVRAVTGRHGKNPVRQHCNAVILPDSKILVVGGTTDGKDAHAVLAVELYDPALGTWTTLGNLSFPRVYHSVALLLPDGRVWIAGSDHDGQTGMDARELTMELFSPPYLSKGSRPTVAVAPSSIGYNTRFDIITPQATQAGLSVALVRCGSVTHGFNPDQRYVRLMIDKSEGRAVTVVSPPNANIAPPGYYLLFIIDNRGVPSVGRFIRMP